jgi:hypothetical protein
LLPFPKGAGAASYMETLLMGDSGIETLSRLPRALTVLAAR